jgi:uncharacterized protein
MENIIYNSNCDLCSQENREKRFNSIKEQFQAVDLKNFEYDFEIYSRPYSMLLGLTNDCNLECSYCFVKQEPKYMSYEIAEKAVEWLKENYKARKKEEKLNIIFFGGEPLLCFDSVIVPLVEKYKEEADFSITTNGYLLDEDKVDFFYKNNVEVLLSCDGIKKVQNSQRKAKIGDSFNTVIKNIPYLLLRKPDTTMRATITKESLPYLYETILMAEEMGFKSISFCPNAFEDWGIEEEIIYENQMMKIGLHIYKSFFNEHKEVIKVDPLIKTYNKIELSLSNNLKYNNQLLRCGLGTTSCAITPEGNIVPCQEKISNPTFILGDIFNGISKEKHKNYLEWYINKLNNYTCDRLCINTKECVHCLSDICPSRMEDLKFQKSTPECIYNRINLRIANRLFKLCSFKINPWINLYFKGGQ